MLKILQARLQQYMNHKLPDVQTGYRKGRGIKDQSAKIPWIMEKAKEFQTFKLDLGKAEEPEIKLPTSIGSHKNQKNIYFFFIDYAKAFDCVDHNKL